MGGGSSFGSNKSKSTSVPEYTPAQKQTFQWMAGNTIPLTEGKENAMTQLMAQGARDAGAVAQSNALQSILGAGGNAGYSVGQMAGNLIGTQHQAVQSTLSQIMARRQAQQQAALTMLGNIPIGPEQQTTSRSSAWNAEMKAGMTS